MTIYRRLFNAISKRSKHEQSWVRPVGKPLPGTQTRQRIRRENMVAFYGIVTRQNPDMSRKARRELARANAARCSREEMQQLRAKAVTA